MIYDQFGEKNPHWKGDKVGYKGIHMWMQRKYGSAKNFLCEHCQGKSGSKTMNWASVDKKYTRDRTMWMTLCKPCHSQYDQKHFHIYSVSHKKYEYSLVK